MKLTRMIHMKTFAFIQNLEGLLLVGERRPRLYQVLSNFLF